MAKIRRVNFEMIDGLRLDLQLNKQAFCRRAGIACFTYNRLDGAKKVTDDVIFRIARVLEVKPSTLVFWEDDTETVRPKSHDPGKTKKIGLVGAKTKISNTKPALVKVKA